MNIQTGTTKPEAVTFVKVVGIKQRTINFDVQEKEDGSFEWVSATLGLGVWNYGAIVTAIIYAKYSSDQIEAINSNMMQLMLDATSVPEDKAKEYRNEALELQAWRNHAKELAKEYLECNW